MKLHHIFIVFLLCLFSSHIYSQEVITKNYLTLEFTVGTGYTKVAPLIGISVQRYIYHDEKVFFPAQFGIYQNISGKPDYIFVQAGIIRKINNKYDLGFYFMNWQGQLQRKDIKGTGYDSPFSIYLQLKNEHFYNTFVHLELNYSVMYLKPGFRFTIKQNLLKLKN